jgi:putative tryptophan/tyrosine transport system substrate-binding protein
MRRRTFIAGIAAAAVVPLAARAQPSPMPTIGFMSSRSSDESQSLVAMLREGLAETGFVAGQNVTIEYRWADGHYERLPALAAELVGRKVNLLIAAGGPPSSLAAKAATTTIPIVFPGSSDAVGLGLVQSLSRPGGNMTGTSLFNVALGGKRLELLRELIPTGDLFGYVVNPANPSAQLEMSEARKTAAALGVRLEVIEASTEQEIETAFGALSRMKVAGMIVAGEPFFDSRRAMIVALAARHAIPASYAWREYAVAGGLVSYGTSLPNAYREAGKYVGRILKGEKPADLPVLQPTKFQLVINATAARTLGLVVPPGFLARADEVIE